jgi:hypothetical protein
MLHDFRAPGRVQTRLNLAHAAPRAALPPGRLEELQHFAAARGDDEALLEYLMRADDGAARYMRGTSRTWMRLQ